MRRVWKGCVGVKERAGGNGSWDPSAAGVGSQVVALRVGEMEGEGEGKQDN